MCKIYLISIDCRTLLFTWHHHQGCMQWNGMQHQINRPNNIGSKILTRRLRMIMFYEKNNVVHKIRDNFLWKWFLFLNESTIKELPKRTRQHFWDGGRTKLSIEIKISKNVNKYIKNYENIHFYNCNRHLWNGNKMKETLCD